jgi:hypothetical protein
MSSKKNQKKNKKNQKKISTKEILRVQVAEMFHKAGYIVDADAFGDESSSWLSISKKDEPSFILELSFNFKGTKFTDFNVWKEISEVTSDEKVF